MIHYPLTPIHEIFKTEMTSFRGSLANLGKMVKDGNIGYTLFELRESDYVFIAEQWETAMINEFQRRQDEEFRKQYGEEY